MQSITEQQLQLRITGLFRRILGAVVFQSYYDSEIGAFRVSVPTNIPVNYIQISNLLRILNKVSPIALIISPLTNRLEYLFFDDVEELTKRSFKSSVVMLDKD